ncbi:MAG: alpha/beta hydrolase [Candidatus Nanopelagicales bacterium]|jgi:pimeloyl-ACP methyl ester carboxylesterase|nr:alpha/beta hydrolase [Candidatus Nanopelagicales bacterium]
MMNKPVVLGVGTAALAGLAVAKWRQVMGNSARETGTFGNGMQYARWGDGPRTVLWMPGGPGSEIPHGVMGAMAGSQFTALTHAGFSVWMVGRRVGMPPGHTVSDMADDYAALIEREFGGRVDVAVGLSYGGMIAQYLAAEHPTCVGRVVLALSAATITEWGRDVDYRWARARADGHVRQAGEVMAEYVFPGKDQRRQRQVLGLVAGRAFADSDVLGSDLMVEAEAERAFDSRDALPKIDVPVLVISAQEDLFFTPEIVSETAALIPGCKVIQYPGKGHLRAGMSTQLARDVLEFAEE